MKPGLGAKEDVSRSQNQGDATRRGGGDGGGGGEPEIDPIIKGLLARLPKSGDVWPEAERKLWLELLSGSFKLIYKDKPTGRIPDHNDPDFQERRAADTKRRAERKEDDEAAN